MSKPNYKQRQAFMKAAGYNVPTNGSWGPYQQKIWDKLTTKQKEYDTTVSGLVSAIKDKITGNTTYKVDPTNQGIVQKRNFNNYTKPSTPFSKAMLGTWIPLATTIAGGYGVISAPLAAGAGLVGGTVGNKIVDQISKVTTGTDFATNAGNTLGISKDAAEYLNPGSYVGGAAGVRRLQNSLYTNVSPLGYATYTNRKGQHISKLSKPQELVNTVVDFFIPKRINTSNPKWIKNMNKDVVPESTIRFRDDAWRLATRQKPHTEKINGVPRSLYTKNKDGSYSYNLDYVKAIKEKYGENPNNSITVNYDSPNVAHDGITTNAGFMSAKYKADISIPFKNKNGSDVIINGKPRLYLGKPEISIEDKWDIQPFKNIYTNQRNLFPQFAKWAQKHQNNPITKVVRNFEAIKSIGGRPFTLRQTLPKGTVSIIQQNRELPK